VRSFGWLAGCLAEIFAFLANGSNGSNCIGRYEEWAHPYFISYQEYERICDRTNALEATLNPKP